MRLALHRNWNIQWRFNHVRLSSRYADTTQDCTRNSIDENATLTQFAASTRWRETRQSELMFRKPYNCSF